MIQFSNSKRLISAGGDIAVGPITYQVNSKQYVTFAVGSSLFAFALRP